MQRAPRTLLQNIAAMIAFALCMVPASTAVVGQTSPARGPVSNQQAGADEMPLDDYLGLLQQIAPAAETGARRYLAVFQQRCGRTMRTSELRRAIADGEGDPALMGFIHAAQTQDVAAETRWAQLLRCPNGRPR